MDVRTGKKVNRGIGATRKGPNLALRSSSNHEEQSIQYCNRLGCSNRPISIKGSQISSSDKVKSSRPAYHSESGKAIVGSSSKTYSTANNIRKSSKEPQKLSPHKKANPSESSKVQDVPSTSSVKPGLPKLKIFSTDTAENVECYKVKPYTRPQKQNQKPYGTCNQITSMGSSAKRSLASRNTNQVSKPVSHGYNANTSSFGLKNNHCTSISQVSSCSSSNSSRSRSTDVKKRALDADFSSSRGKSSSGSTRGNLGAQRNSLSSPSLVLAERPPSQQASRRARNWLPCRDSVPSVRTRRTINGDTRTGLHEHRNGNRSSSPAKAPAVMSQLPQTEISVCESIPSISSELLTDNQNSYGRPGSSNENVVSRSFAYQEDGIFQSFRGLSMDHDGFRRFNIDGIAEALLALEMIEQDEELSYEQLLALETNMFLGGLSFHDRHRDMRLDIDNMSYEELLALGEKMGTVSTALTEEELTTCLKRSSFIPTLPESETSVCEEDDVKCSICQEEYVAGEELGNLGCGHGYHMVCIHQWLKQKNWCPICKIPAVTS